MRGSLAGCWSVLALGIVLLGCGAEQSTEKTARPAGQVHEIPTKDETPATDVAPEGPVPGAGAVDEEPGEQDWRDIPWISPLATRVMEEGHAPVPFFAHERSNAYVVGLRWVKSESTGRPPPAIVVREVIAVGGEGYTIRLSMRDEHGKVDPDMDMEITTEWSRVKPSPAPKLADVDIRRETITVPAGTFDCLRYDSGDAEGGGTSQSVWYAREVPFSAVRQVNRVGTRTATTELIELHMPSKVQVPEPGDALEPVLFEIALDADGTVRLGEESYTFGGADRAKQSLALRGFARRLRKLRRRHPLPRDGSADRLTILIRADRKAKWQWVQWMKHFFADPAIGITQIQFAVVPATKPDK